MLKQKQEGYRMNLYRSDENRWLAGVCGGLAENLDWPPWVVRLVTVFLFMVTGSFILLLYILAVFFLERRDHAEPSSSLSEKDTGIKEKIFNYRTPSNQINNLHQRLRKIDQRVQSMEGYVTSRQFEIDQALKNT